MWADIMDDEIHSEYEAAFDNVTGQALDPIKVRAARMDEIRALEGMGVREVVGRSMCLERAGRPPIKGGWVDVSEGDDVHESHRSRYVAKEIRQARGGAGREGLLAAMPPLEALKLMTPSRRAG